MSVNIKNLQSQIDYLNEITGNPKEVWTRVNGQNVAHIGSYELTGAYGGWNLEQIVTDGGGVTMPLGSGFYPKKELYAKINAFIIGIETGLKQKKE